ncbi:MAG: hypothetical protein AAF791_06085 [Bacteroidota bacterium]
MRLIPVLIVVALVGGCSDPIKGAWYDEVHQTAGWWETVGYDLDADDLEDPEIAFGLLLNTNEFADSHVGIGSVPSDQYLAFNTLLQREDAPKAFGVLLRRAHPAGQLYALNGLYLTDRARFENEVWQYATSSETVLTLSGCVGGFATVGEIVRHPEGIRLPEGVSYMERAKAWFEALNRGEREPDSLLEGQRDIVGGVWPEILDARGR